MGSSSSRLRGDGDHKRVLASSVRSGAPYRQGDLDGLCGLYAAINALAMLAARHTSLNRRASVTLFKQGLAIVANTMPLIDAVAGGIEPDLCFDLAQQLAKAAGAKCGLSFAVARLFDEHSSLPRRVMHEAIEQTLTASSVVLASLEGRHDHYTLIVAHTPTQYRLLDSGDLCWLDKASCGTGSSLRRHRITAAWAMTVSTGGARAK